MSTPETAASGQVASLEEIVSEYVFTVDAFIVLLGDLKFRNRIPSKNKDYFRKYIEYGNIFSKINYRFEALLMYCESLKHLSKADSQYPRGLLKKGLLLFDLQLYEQYLREYHDFKNSHKENLKEIAELEKNKSEAELKDKRTLRTVPVPKTPYEYIKFLNVNLAMEKFEKERNIIATKDINTHEMLIMEKPFISGPVKADALMCWHCMSVCVKFLPCACCSVAIFCSQKCRTRANQMYHDYEINLIETMGDLFYEYSVSIRMILSQRNYNTTIKDQYTFGDWGDAFYTNHVKAEQFSKRDIQEFGYVSTLIYQILLKTDFLEKIEYITTDRSKKATILKGLIFKSLLMRGARSFMSLKTQTYRNDQCIYSITYDSIFPVMSYFKHSCVPNATVTISNNICTVRAIGKIKEGVPVTLCYGDLFSERVCSSRKDILKINYNIECKCIACENPDTWKVLVDVSNEIHSEVFTELEEMAKTLYASSATQFTIKNRLKKLSATFNWEQPSKAFGLFLDLSRKWFQRLDSSESVIDVIKELNPTMDYIDSRNESLSNSDDF